MALIDKDNSFGAWAFLGGVILAILVGVSASIMPIEIIERFSTQVYGMLVIIGLIVGFAFPTGKDSEKFMIAGTVLVIVSRFGMESVSGSLLGLGIGESVASIFAALLVLFVPATIVVALKTVFSITRV